MGSDAQESQQQPVPEASSGAPPPSDAKKVFTQDHLREHTTAKTCWLAIHGNVYDVTDFLEEHPGGYDIILTSTGACAQLSVRVWVGAGETARACVCPLCCVFACVCVQGCVCVCVLERVCLSAWLPECCAWRDGGKDALALSQPCWARRPSTGLAV